MTDRAICRKITGLSEAIEENLVLCLLLFRRDSKRYIHRIEQEMLDNLQHSYREETDSIVDLSPAFTTRASINNDTLSKIHIYYPNREMQKKFKTIVL